MDSRLVRYVATACRGWRSCIAISMVAMLSVLMNDHWVRAEDRGPTAEQLTERTQTFGALWEALRISAAGLRFRFEDQLVSTGEFDDAQVIWLRNGFSVEGGVPITDSFGIGVSPSFAWEQMRVDDRGDISRSLTGRDDRATDFYETGLRIGTAYKWNDTWGGELVSGFTARHESGARFVDGTQVGGSAAINYRRGSWLRLRLGIGLGADLSDQKLRVSPVYRIQIKPRKGWTIETSGIGGAIDWKATRRTALRLAGEVDGTQYRLDSSPAFSGDAVLQRRQARLGVDLRHRLTDVFRLRGGIGVVLDEELSVNVKDEGDVFTRRNRDPSVTFGLGMDIRL